MNGTDPVSRETMMDLQETARATGGRLEGANARFSGVTTDSRKVSAGDLFVALSGERFDGHAYVAEAMSRGAVAAITARVVETAMPLPQVVVADTRLALGKLAGHWRARFAMPLTALTGSNGKTTVKEMITAILATHCGSRSMVLATEGNLNNDIGMPLTLLRLREAHRYAVIEMGMNHEGEIDYLTRIAQPTVALVNNAQRAHVGILGSVEAIARAKGEIYAGLGPSGIAVINEDDAFARYWRGLNRGRREGRYCDRRPENTRVRRQSRPDPRARARRYARKRRYRDGRRPHSRRGRTSHDGGSGRDPRRSRRVEREGLGRACGL